LPDAARRAARGYVLDAEGFAGPRRAS